jgi:tetratricopeptide (TPR) repeat protein
MPSLHDQEEYREYAERSLADMNQALLLDPANGDFYYERFAVHANLAEIEFYRVDYDYWRELALADAQSAIAYGTRRTYVDRDVAYSLVDLRRYQEALDMFGELPFVPGATLNSDAGIQVGLAESYQGLGQLDEALQHINLAIAASPGEYKQFDRAVILYGLNRLDEALSQLSSLIDEKPCCFGPRYYLRSLVRFRLGQTDLALADIDTGSGLTWQRGGVRSYVLGLTALDSGDTEQALSFLLEAEATLHPQYSSTILEQIQQDLTKLSAVPLTLTPSVPSRLTPAAPFN